MTTPQSKIVAAVEIGTAKTVVLVGEIINQRSLSIVGMGQSASAGMKKGEILDFQAASTLTHNAMLEAEQSASATIEAVYLAQTGNHLQGFSNDGSVTVSSASGLVSRDDMHRATREGKGKELPAGRVYIHHIKNQVLLDGRAVKDPYQMEGQRLDVRYWSVHGDERIVRDHIHVINGFGLPVEDMIISSVATGSTVLSEEEKKAGALVLDIGCGTTDWALYQHGFITRTGVLAIGGDHFTNDLALGLRISRDNAERLKKQHGCAVAVPEAQSGKVWMVGDQMIGDRQIPKKALVQIIEARSRELFSVIKKQLGTVCSLNHLPAGVIITGGTSQLTGIAESASQTLKIPVRQAAPPEGIQSELSGPEFSTVLGLLYYALSGQHQEEFITTPKKKGLLYKVAKMISG